MMNIQAEISFYPLKTDDLGVHIFAFVEDLKSFEGLEVEIGEMSSLIYGPSEVVFSALRQAFERAGERHRAAMVVKFLNSNSE